MRIRVFQGIEMLHQPDNGVTRLGEGVLFCEDQHENPTILHLLQDIGQRLTTKTNPRPTVKRQILPSMLGVFFPPLRPEGRRILAPVIGAAVHGEDIVRDHLALLHINRRASVGTASDGEGGVFCSDAEVDRDGGLKA